MFLTTHTSAAILIASKVSNPILVIIFAFLSHFVLDAIPHGEGNFFSDPKKNHHQKMVRFVKAAIIDLLIASIFLFSFLYYVQPDNVWIFIWASLAAWLPDFSWGAIELFKIKSLKWFYIFHHKMHDLLDVVYPMKYGLVFQALFIVSILALILT
ncbi:hypothetical protein HN670_01390 [bacterium]|jgi:hypothetical protein|nr:hypothetical protein [bacterium]